MNNLRGYKKGGYRITRIVLLIILLITIYLIISLTWPRRGHKKGGYRITRIVLLDYSPTFARSFLALRYSCRFAYASLLHIYTTIYLIISLTWPLRGHKKREGFEGNRRFPTRSNTHKYRVLLPRFPHSSDSPVQS